MNKRWWIGAVAALASVLAVGFALKSGAESPAAAQAESQEPTKRLLLGVEGVSCGSCEAHIRDALEARPGVRRVGIDLAARTVTVEYVAGQEDPKSLAEVITRAGYPARFLASGPSVAPPTGGQPAPRRGCGGNCCAGG